MKRFKSYKKWLNEKFVDNDDPIQSMGVGLMHEVDKFIQNKKSQFKYVDYEIIRNTYDKLMFCIKYKSPIELIDYLIPILLKEQNIDVNSKDEFMYKHLLVNAIVTNNLECIKLLIEKYNVSIHPKKDDTKSLFTLQFYEDTKPLLHYAIMFRRVEILKYLLENLYDPNYEDGKWFIEACGTKDEEIVKAFLDAGVDVNIRNGAALYYAALKGSTKIMRLLLKHGAKVNDNLISNLHSWKLRGSRKLVTDMMFKLGYKF